MCRLCGKSGNATSLDYTADFNHVLYAAVELGIRHAAEGKGRLASANALEAIANNAKLGQLSVRRFQSEILTRAYGLAFINRDKLAYARARKNMRTAALAWRRNGRHKFLVAAKQTRDYALSIERAIKRGGV